MKNAKDTLVSRRWELLLKEIDLIHSNIKNLDDIIYKTKNFSVALWGGSIYLIAQHVEVEGMIVGISKWKLLIYLTVLIPIIFWGIHYRWQKHLSMCSARERMISWFINSQDFSLWLDGEESVKFPIYDIPGWLYTRGADESRWQHLGIEVNEVYLLDHKTLNFWKILFYKDAKWFYPLMMVISLLFGLLSQ